MAEHSSRQTALCQQSRGGWNGAICPFAPTTNHAWLSGIDDSLKNAIGAAVPGGKPRVLYVSPVRIRLHDVAPNGHSLLTRGGLRLGALVGDEGKSGEIELAGFDGSLTADLSRDGSILLFSEAAEAEEPHCAVYIRPTDGSSSTRRVSGR